MQEKVDVALKDVVQIQRKIEKILNFTTDESGAGSQKKRPRYMQDSSQLRSQYESPISRKSNKYIVSPISKSKVSLSFSPGQSPSVSPRPSIATSPQEPVTNREEKSEQESDPLSGSVSPKIRPSILKAQTVLESKPVEKPQNIAPTFSIAEDEQNQTKSAFAMWGLKSRRTSNSPEPSSPVPKLKQAEKTPIKDKTPVKTQNNTPSSPLFNRWKTAQQEGPSWLRKDKTQNQSFELKVEPVGQVSPKQSSPSYLEKGNKIPLRNTDQFMRTKYKYSTEEMGAEQQLKKKYYLLDERLDKLKKAVKDKSQNVHNVSTHSSTRKKPHLEEIHLIKRYEAYRSYMRHSPLQKLVSINQKLKTEEAKKSVSARKVKAKVEWVS